VPIITTQIKKSIIIEQEERMEESQKIKRAQDKQPLLYIEIKTDTQNTIQQQAVCFLAQDSITWEKININRRAGMPISTHFPT